MFMSYKLILRGSIASMAVYATIIATAELSLRLPLDNTERDLTVFHIGAITSLVALFWSVTPRQSFLLHGVLFILSATVPTWLMILWH